MDILDHMCHQAILDLDGSNSVSQEEFLIVARTYVDLSKMAMSAAAEEVKEALQTCSRRMAANKVRWHHR